MKTLLLTGYNDGFSALGDLTAPRIMAYASRHSYDFKCFRMNNAGIEATWQKVDETYRALMNYDRVLWIDADMMVTNSDIRHDYDSGLHVSQDWGTDATERHHFSAGAFLACRNVIGIFDELMDAKQASIAAGVWEQEPMRRIAFARYRDRLTVHPRRAFNAVAPEVHPSVVEPWQPGDWCAHFTMIPLDERVNLFRKYSE